MRQHVASTAAGSLPATEINPAVETTFGYRREEILGKDVELNVQGLVAWLQRREAA